LSNEGIKFIILNEGLILQVYKDIGGNLTVGVGHKITNENLKFKDKITEKQAYEFLTKDLIKFEDSVNSMNYRFDQSEFDSLVDFAFNNGIRNLESLCHYGNRSKDQIYSTLIKYDMCNGKHRKSLYHRRLREQRLWKGESVEHIFNLVKNDK